MSTNRSAAYPESRTEDVVDVLHGREVGDPYRWLEDDDDPEVRTWEEAQNAHTRAFLAGLPHRAPLATRFDELLRFAYRTYARRVLNGPRRFWQAREADQEKPTWWTSADDDAEPALVLDPNTWGASEGCGYATPSRDGRYLAYGRDVGGSEDYELRIRDVESGEDLPDRVRGHKHWMAGWLPDGEGFYYVCRPREGEVPAGEETYWTKVFLHRLGTDTADDVEIFGHDTVKEYWHWLEVSEDGAWLVGHRSEMVRTELFLRRRAEGSPWKPVATGFDARYHGLVVDGRLLIHTDRDAPRGKVYWVDVEDPRPERWRELVPECEDNLEQVQAIDGRLYLTYLHDAHTRIAVHALDGTRLRDVSLPGLGTADVSGHFSRSEVVVTYASFDHPPTWYRYDFERDALEEVLRMPVSFDPKAFTTEQVWFASKDATRVPMFLVHRKGLVRDGRTPVFLTGYGGFRISRTPAFLRTFVPWLEAGGVVAVANIRGGGEFGAEWYESAIKTRKQTSYDDFLAAAEHLVAEGWTTPERLTIGGGSNGGLLVGAALTQRPDLFRAVYCAVPLLDMVRYHRFSFANVWTSDYGSAEDPAELAAILAYSPYHRVEDGVRYPAVFLTAGTNDSRVHPLHARKMAARLQAADGDGGPILLDLKRQEGHTGSPKVSELVANAADQWAFLMAAAGVEPPSPDV